MTVNLNALQSEIEIHLSKIEKLLPPSYKITLLARCTSQDLVDADIMLTLDTLPEIQKAVEKRIHAKEDQ